MLTLTLLMAAAAPAPPTAVELLDRVELQDRSLRSFEVQLPADAWHKLSGEIPVPHAGGTGFTVRPEGVGLAIDTNGDGQTDRLIEGKIDEVTKARSAWVRLEAKRANGESFEYAARLQDAGKGWHWAASGCVQGMAGKTKVRVLDLDGDGQYDGYGSDAVILGTGNIASYLSEVINLDGELYTAQVAADGSSIALEAYTGEVGTIDAKSALETDGKLLSAVVRSADGKLCFDLARARGPMKVPAGEYKILSGQLGLGDARLMVGPGAAKSLTINTGANLNLEWGGPARAEFSYERMGSEIAFSPDKVWYYGKAGEEYFGWDPIGKSPEFSVKERKAGVELAKALFPGTC